MSMLQNYLGAVIERLGLNDISADLKAPKATLSTKRESMAKRLALLFESALSGDSAAALVYGMLCEDYLRACRDELKSSSAYQDEHRRIVTSVERLQAES